MAKPRNHQVRIISGEWRGRKLAVANSQGLRPTPDRVRETLFNWVTDSCRNGVVLDCFAGSGVLGFEAASRGAANVVLVEKEIPISRLLTDQLRVFNSDRIEVITNDIEQYLTSCTKVFDLVFIDPPYVNPSLRRIVLNYLLERQLLADKAMIYLEWPRQENFDLEDDRLVWHRQKRAGQIEYAVAQYRLSR